MKKLLLPLLLVASCQAAEDLSGMEVVEITAEQEAFLKAYKENNCAKMVELLQKGVEVPTYKEEGGLIVQPIRTKVSLLSHLAASFGTKNHEAGLEITRIFAQQGVTGNTRTSLKEGESDRTAFYGILREPLKYITEFQKKMAAVFIAYGDDIKQAKKDALVNKESDLTMNLACKNGGEKDSAQRAIPTELEKKAKDIDTFFRSQKLQELIEKEKVLMPELPAKAAGKTL
jgi:hypothetical protein